MFITFEGIDGSGKSTQVTLLRDRLSAAGRDVLFLREPGGTPLSEGIRSLLLDSDHPVHPFAEMLLFSAARAQLVAERIRPALRDGTIVLCDRFFDSTTAYQGAGRGLTDTGWLRDFHLRVTGGLVPDRTYLVRVPVATALERRGHRAEDRMEREGDSFHRVVAEAYESISREESDRFRVLDGRLGIADLHEVVWADLQELLSGGTA